MPVGYDKQGNPIEASEADLLRMYKAGQIRFQKGQTFRAIEPGSGKVYEGTPEQVIGQMGEGWEVEGAEGLRAREMEAEFGGPGGELLAAGAGLLRGVSVGLSDPVLRALGVEARTLEGIAEVSPWASGVFEAGGAVLPAFLSGGTTVPGQAGAAVVRTGVKQLVKGGVQAVAKKAPAALLLKASLAAERGIAKALGGTAKAKIGAAAIAQGGEGAVWMLGNSISQAAIHDEPLRAEEVLANVGFGAILGGGFGGGLKGLGQGLGGAVGKVKRRMGKKTADAVVEAWEKETGNTAIPGLVGDLQAARSAEAKAVGASGAKPKIASTQDVTIGPQKIDLKIESEPGPLKEFWGNISESTIGARKGTIKELSDPEARRLATQPPEVRDAFARDLAENQNVIIDAMDAGREVAGGLSKKVAFINKIPEANAIAAREVASDILGSGIPLKVIDDAGDEILNPILGAGGLLAEVDELFKVARSTGAKSRTMLKELRGATDRFQRKVRAAQGKADEAAKINAAMDDYKRVVQTMRTRAGRTLDTDGTIPALRENLESIQERVRKPLELDEIWGAEAAGAQREINAAWVEHLAHAKRRPDHRMVEAYESSNWEMNKQARPQGFRSLIDDMGSTNYDLDGVWMKNNRQTSKKLMDAIEKHYELNLATKTKFDAARKAIKRMGEIEAQASKTVGRQNQLKELERAVSSSGLGGSVGIGSGILGGAMIGGLPGALIGGVVGAVLNPAQTIRRMTVLDRIGTLHGISRKVAAKISKGVKGFFSKGRRVGRGATVPISVVAFAPRRDSENINTPGLEDQEDFRRVRDDLRGMMENPDRIMGRLENRLGDLGTTMPELADQIGMAAVNAAAHLLQHAPKSGTPTGPLDDMRGREPPALLSELTEWWRRYQIVQQPTTALDHLADGTLRKEEVETLGIVYPRLLQKMIQGIMDRIENGEETTYQQRVRLSYLTGQPMDPTMQPQFMATALTMGQPPPAPAPKGKLTGKKKSKKMTEKSKEKLSDAHETTFQRIAAEA